MSDYKVINETSVIRLPDNAIIPFDTSNRDYREYLEWVEQGNEPHPADPPPVISITLSPSQQIILADGIDVANVTITGEPSATVEFTVNGEPFSSVLNASGLDTIELDCDTPNTTLVVQAGTARAVVYAVEVPA